MARLHVKVVPGSPRHTIVGGLDGALQIKVTAPPEKGRADEVTEALPATTLGIRTDGIQVESGHFSTRQDHRVHRRG